MRVLLLSLVVFVLAIVLGVIAHHTITTEHFGLGLASLLATSALCSAVSAMAVGAAKKERRLWPKIFSTALHLLAALVFIGPVASSYFPLSLKIAHAFTGVVLVLWTLLLVSTLKKMPNQTPEPTAPSGRGSS